MYTKSGGVAAYHVVWIGLCLRSVPGVRDLASAVDDSPHAQSDPNNTICCHSTTLSIHTTVV